MMTTNSNGQNHQPRAYIHSGRVRGLRQGGRRMRMKSKSRSHGYGTSKKPSLASGARFKNVVSQLSKRPGGNDASKMAAFKGAVSARARRA